MLSSRRYFLNASWICLGSAFSRSNHQGPAPDAPPSRKTAPLAEALVHEWVWRGHFDLDGVKRMLAAHPSLLNATYDWGNGDYEMAIGGAGHLGRRDIAEYLLAQGSRMDLFVAAMLGRLDVVKATLTAYAPLLKSRGPHGFTLVHHARQGGAQAREVLDYLQSLGAE
jgi:hypothetical protein